MLTHSNTSSSVVKDRDLHIMTTVAHQAAAVKLAILEENLENKNKLVTHTPHQGGRIFEISWEPNFPLNNFARNNGKIAPSSTK